MSWFLTKFFGNGTSRHVFQSLNRIRSNKRSLCGTWSLINQTRGVAFLQQQSIRAGLPTGIWPGRSAGVFPLSKSNPVLRCNTRSASLRPGSVLRNKTTSIYIAAVAVTVLGCSYAAVPLYRLYCQASGLGGTVKQAESGEKLEKMERKPERSLRIRFNADTSSTMQWKFKPQQSEVRVAPGETALAFYTATNATDTAITGISTYNVIPFEAGQYFNKIQCFCFEEQRLNPNEQVDMPVFFYIDPEFTEDPAMAKVDTITLSYTFFESKEAEKMGL
ncbi:cytochrome c oxidase assembly protein COX11, mitochondrial [Nematostella vectensis]|nr:cytochrome c oxidase assembly protein COX11, mitochondrial [Nematostella vectensis]